MGQKMDPHGLRVGVIKDWDSKWYAGKKEFSDKLVEDYKIREYVKKKLYVAGISKVEIERTASNVRVNVLTAKPGLALGKNGEIVNKVKEDLTKPSAYFYLAHEIAHCLTNANHGDKKFEEAIQKYNSKFSPKTASDPDDSYNKKYLPTFYKKDAWLDNAKSDEQFQKDLITKPWKKEKYFNY